MADTRRLAMLKAFETVLDGVGKPTGLTVDRKPHQAIEKHDLPTVRIAHGGGVRVNTEVNDLTENTDVVELSIMAVCDESDPPDDAIDPYWSWVLSSLEADPTLGGVVSEITLRPAGRTEFDPADKVYVRIQQEVEVQYYARRTDPESQT